MSLECKTKVLATGKDLYGKGMLPDFVDIYSTYEACCSDATKNKVINSSAADSYKLIDLALPILDLVNKLKNQIKIPHKDILQSLLVLQIDSFTRKARQANYDEVTIALAHYILCTYIDKVFLDTTWTDKHGGQTNQLNLLHQLIAEETICRYGDFFSIAKMLCKESRKNLELLKLCYLCLKLGFTTESYLGHENLPEFESLMTEINSHIFSIDIKSTPLALLVEPNNLTVHENISEIKQHKFFSPQFGGLIALIIVIGISVFITLNIKLNRISRPLYKLHMSDVVEKNTGSIGGVDITR